MRFPRHLAFAFLAFLTAALIATPPLALGAPAFAAAADDGEQPPRRGGSRAGRGAARGGGETRAALSFHGALRYLHEAGSDLFTANAADFGQTPVEEFEGGFGAEIAFTVHPRLDVFFGAEWSETAFDTSYRDLTFDDGSEIVHATGLDATDLDLGVRFRFLPPGGAWQPYLSGGFSGSLYRYIEDGDFVDSETAEVFYDRYEERQLLPGFFLALGVDSVINRGRGSRLEAFGEARYSAYGGEHEDDFAGFGNIENHWLTGRFGLRFRF